MAVAENHLSFSIPKLRAQLRTGDYEEWAEAERGLLFCLDALEACHDYMNLVRPAHMDQARWEDLKAMHASRAREKLDRLFFGQ